MRGESCLITRGVGGGRLTGIGSRAWRVRVETDRTAGPMRAGRRVRRPCRAVDSSPVARRGPSARLSESGLPIEPVYGPEALDGWDPARRLGEPGEFPFTRGVYPSMYTGRPWTMRQYAGFGTAAESNAATTSCSRAGTDRPVGRLRPADPDGLRLRRRRSRTARSARSASPSTRSRTCGLLFDGIPLDQVSTSMTINAPAALLLLLYQLVAEEQGVARRALNGTIQNDVLKEYIARGTYIYPPQAVAAADHRHLRLLPSRDPALEHHLHLRLPHGRGRGDARAGDRVHPRQRHRVRPRGHRRRAQDVDDFAPAAGVLLRRRARRCSRRSRSSARPGGSGRR